MTIPLGDPSPTDDNCPDCGAPLYEYQRGLLFCKRCESRKLPRKESDDDGDDSHPFAGF
jgi:uncharacterized Zn finger protein (UPF0148 family)